MAENSIRTILKTSSIDDLLMGEKVLLKGINDDDQEDLAAIAYVDRDQEEHPGFYAAIRSENPTLINLYGYTLDGNARWRKYADFGFGKWIPGRNVDGSTKINPDFKKYDSILNEVNL